MVDIDKQIEYWRQGAREDWIVAKKLLDDDEVRHGLFLVHLALEKAIKAKVCLTTQELAPRIHNLVRLTELAGLELTDEQRDTLADLNAFDIEGRYPHPLLPAPTIDEARAYAARAEEVFQWLIQQ